MHERPFPGMRYVLLHTLAHVLIRQFAIECGYSSSALRERIYCRLRRPPAPVRSARAARSSGRRHGACETHDRSIVPWLGDLCGELVEVDILPVYQSIDLAEAEEIVLRREAQYVEHRMHQNTRPRARSQSHNPQRPRLSAVSMRQRTVSWIRSASRARDACQWKAKPRMSTTKPVVADSVTVSVVVERQLTSASLRGWTTARKPMDSAMPGRWRRRRHRPA